MRANAVSSPRVTWTDPPPKVEEIICASSSAKVILLHEGRFLFFSFFPAVMITAQISRRLFP